MKILYGLVIVGAVGLFVLLFWSDHPQVLLQTGKGSVAWYRKHPQALARENLKCWKLVQQSSFDNVDRVMAGHPHCHKVYEALQQEQDAEHE